MTNRAKPKLEYVDGRPSVLRKPTVWRELNFYKRSEILFQLTVAFCRRFLPKHGDRTVDQMVQAARSTKQNIVEGYSDGQTSFEIELRLLGVARGSNQELLADYRDYLTAHGLCEWKDKNPRFDALHLFCREKTSLADFQTFFEKWTDDEMANCAICLAHMIDKALTTTLAKKDKEFVTQGGIKERMTAARLGYRTDQRERIAALERENAALRAENARLKAALADGQREYGQRAQYGQRTAGIPGTAAAASSGLSGIAKRSGISGKSAQYEQRAAGIPRTAAAAASSGLSGIAKRSGISGEQRAQYGQRTAGIPGLSTPHHPTLKP